MKYNYSAPGADPIILNAKQLILRCHSISADFARGIAYSEGVAFKYSFFCKTENWKVLHKTVAWTGLKSKLDATRSRETHTRIDIDLTYESVGPLWRPDQD